jgi:lipopolysaccharide transport system ATP-binding protein
MAAVKTLCTKGIVLKNGCHVFEDTQLEAVNYYQNSHNTNSSFMYEGSIETAPGNENIRVLNFEVKPLKGEIIQISSGVLFELVFYNFRSDINLDATFELRSVDELPIFHHGKIISSNKDSKKGIYKVSGTIPENILNAGNYKFKLIFGENQRQALFIFEDIIQFEIMNEAIGSNSSVLPGIIRPNIEYKLEFIS